MYGLYKYFSRVQLFRQKNMKSPQLWTKVKLIQLLKVPWSWKVNFLNDEKFLTT